MKSSILFCIVLFVYAVLPAFDKGNIRLRIEFSDEKGQTIRNLFSPSSPTSTLTTDQGTFFTESVKGESEETLAVKAEFRENIRWEKAEIIIPYSFTATDLLYADGYQSWSASGLMHTEEKMVFPGFWVPKVLLNSGDYLFADVPSRKGMIYGWQYGYILKNSSAIQLIGSLDESEGFTQIIFDVPHSQIIIRKDLEGAVWNKGEKKNILSVYFEEGAMNPVFERYFKAGNRTLKPQTPKTGWCSWYQYYTRVSEKIVKENLNALKQAEAPVNYIQIDDGWQGAVGDWLIVNEKFPSGLSALSGEIHQKGYQSGLWLAPFICEQKSALFKKHPDWILKNAKGKPVKAGYNPGWSGNFYALNIEHPEVREYIRTVFRKVTGEWGFDMVKLDFLYAVAILPQNGKSRGQVMSEAMEFLRECLGEKKILGCGVPMASLGNTVDYCRIGPDVGLVWNNNLIDKIARFRETISCKRSVINALNRYQTNGYGYLNDPDVYNLRGNDNRLTPEQKKIIFTINQISGGLILTSDNPAEYSPEQKNQFLSQFPVLEKSGIEFQRFETSLDNTHSDRIWEKPSGAANTHVKKEGVYGVAFTSGEYQYYYLFNLGDEKARVRFPYDDYVWMHPDSGYPLLYKKNDFISLSSFQSVLLKHIPANAEYSVVTDNLHLFPGSEIQSIKTENYHIQLTFHPQNKIKSGIIWIQVPELQAISINKTLCFPEEREGRFWVKYSP
ncbi:MAG: alpha-galactosidase [Bacteroidia bacterium]|nr:alpha-galactosidase [Bacteroidia bacterium]